MPTDFSALLDTLPVIAGQVLAPQSDDAWPFAVELNSKIERLLQTYRADLTD